MLWSNKILNGTISIKSIKSRLISYDQRFYLSRCCVESHIFSPMHYSVNAKSVSVRNIFCEVALTGLCPDLRTIQLFIE